MPGCRLPALPKEGELIPPLSEGQGDEPPNRYMVKIFYTSLLVLLPILAASQISNLRSKTLPVEGGGLGVPQLIDSLTIIPRTVEVRDAKTGEIISPKNYKIENNRITFDPSAVHRLPSAVHLKYRTFPFDLSAPYARLDSAVLNKKNGDYLIGVPYNPYADQERPLLPQQGLDYNGNYTRGLSFGNNQNLVLSSQFNLQMAGTLGDLEILAAITDNNIPLQPEGNTQQLREFDKIFIQVAKNESKLIAGDYELKRPNSYFMNYYKKLQGATFSRRWTVDGGRPAPKPRGRTGGSLPRNFGDGRGKVKKRTGVLDTRGSIAVARGKFARNTVAAQEGNQGPYRLEGAEGERFIIVLSGTEKVFVDGKLMQRGLDADYVIDYNAGHVTFTNRRLITKDSRIVVEFDYNVQDYQRSLYAFNTELRTDKMRLYLNTYSEQDGRRPIDDEFNEVEKEALQLAGDSEVGAVVNSIDTVAEFSAFRVLYELRDTMVNGIFYDNVLVFSSDPERAKYTASFALTGAGNGNYVLDTETSANGRVFRWSAPDPLSGLPTGEYEPVRRLVAPNQQQLYTAGLEFDPTKKTKLRAEVALSNFDKNRLSGINDGDNLGAAATVGVRHVLEFGKKEAMSRAVGTGSLRGQGGGKGVDSEVRPRGNAFPPATPAQRHHLLGWQLELSADYEFTQQKFKELNPYRPAEFTRDWNVNSGANDVAILGRLTDEHLGKAGFVLKSPNAGSLQYRFGGFFRDTVYTGTRHFGKYEFRRNGFELWGQGDFLTTENTTRPDPSGGGTGNTGGGRSEFFRPKLNVAVPIFRDSTGAKYWRAGLYAEREKNSRFTKIINGADTLNRASFYYDLAKIYLESPVNEGFGIKTSFQRRRDNAPIGTGFSASTLADELNVQGNWRQSRNSRLSWNFTWRKLTIEDDELTNLDPAETYLGRLNYTLNLLRGAAQWNTSYEIGSGQERKVEVTYLQVPQGEGTHQWTDRNGDGKVQVDEVEIAPFQDMANAVRVNVFTDDFIRTNNVTFNQSLRLEPKAVWFNKKGVRKFMSRFSTQSSLQITRKVRVADGVSAWNPFQLDVVDTALVSTRSAIFNTLFFNRSDPKFDLQMGMSDNQNKFVQTTGFESRRQQKQFFKSRWNVTRSISFQTTFTLGNDEQGSEQFETRRYRIRSFETKPQLTFQPTNNFRTAVTWRFKTSKNELGTEKESSTTNDLKLETVFNKSSTTSIRSEFSLVNIAFDGAANSPVGFAFLQGLQNGKNYLWNITLDRQVAKNIRLGITYEGRKTGTANVVHVGRAQVGAVF
ncbi:MAG TPA: hypothetical protein ENJ95_24645 [Bacteroidetes bacterium]|nr:hypothetical protein [Bacteroidota bacterium]